MNAKNRTARPPSSMPTPVSFRRPGVRSCVQPESDVERRARLLADARSLASLWPRSDSCHYDEVEESFPSPSTEEEEAVRNSPNFCAAVLGWFDGKLLPFGMTLIAISPIDELQDFALVPSATLNALGTALDVLCIHHERVIGTERSEGG